MIYRASATNKASRALKDCGVAKKLKFEVYRTADGDLRGRLYRGINVVRFPPNGLPKDLGTADRALIERNVRAALEVLFEQPSEKPGSKRLVSREAKKRTLTANVGQRVTPTSRPS